MKNFTILLLLLLALASCSSKSECRSDAKCTWDMWLKYLSECDTDGMASLMCADQGENVLRDGFICEEAQRSSKAWHFWEVIQVVEAQEAGFPPGAVEHIKKVQVERTEDGGKEMYFFFVDGQYFISFGESICGN